MQYYTTTELLKLSEKQEDISYILHSLNCKYGKGDITEIVFHHGDQSGYIVCTLQYGTKRHLWYTDSRGYIHVWGKKQKLYPFSGE